MNDLQVFTYNDTPLRTVERETNALLVFNGE